MLTHRRDGVPIWLALLTAMTALAGGCEPAPDRVPEIKDLNRTPAFNRAAIYHQDEGIRLFPYEWFLALERADSTERFASDTNIRRYAFLPDADDAGNNPDRLPVGFTKYDPLASVVAADDEFACDGAPETVPSPPLAQLGFNCAACHTSELRYTNPKTGRRYLLRIDGGPSMQNNLKFFLDLRDALKATAVSDEKSRRFADRLRERRSQDRTQQAVSPQELRACLAGYLMKKRLEAYNGAYPTDEAVFPFPWGFGRLDALGRGGNTIFGKLDLDNLRRADAPVSIPSMWDTIWSYDRVQWNGAIRDFRARYIGQAIGLNVWVRLKGDRRRLFESTLDMKKLNGMVESYQKLPPPSWPFEIFASATDEAARTKLATQGKQLYKKLCAGCHVPTGKVGNRYKVRMKTVSEIGTDPVSATNFFDRTVKTGSLSVTLNATTLPAVKVAEFLTSRILEKKGVDASRNKWTAELAYLARPHAGVWATAPFLHNGSIPNLYLLLSLQDERDAQARTFCLGDLEFDPEQVGFRLKRPPCAADESLFVTALPGNRNTGHEFRDYTEAELRSLTEEEREQYRNGRAWPLPGIIGRTLKPEERRAIVEYLKTCDFSLPWNENEQQIVYVCQNDT